MEITSTFGAQLNDLIQMGTRPGDHCDIMTDKYYKYERFR